MIVRTRTFFENISRTFWLLLGLCVFLSASYLALISLTISNVVAREQAERNISLMYSRVGELESSYLAEKNAITLSLARTLGYLDSSRVEFVSRAPLKNR